MRVQVFLGDYYTGKRLGAVEDLSFRRVGENALLVSGAGMQTLLGLLAQESPEIIDSVVFSLMTEDTEFRACRIRATGSMTRVDYESERPL